MQKTVWLEFLTPSPWHSFNQLKESYLRQYQQVLENLEIKKIHWTTYSDLHFWSELSQKKVEKIILSDIRFDLNLWLPLLYKHLPEVEIEVHIYGNPIERMKRLTRLDGLDSQSLSFVVGSKVQVDVFATFLNQSTDCKYYPFVTDLKSPDVTVAPQNKFIYAGRISHQKNVIPLMHFFESVFSKSPEAELFIAGAPDNVGLPTEPKGYYLNYPGEKFFLNLAHSKGSTYLGHLSHGQMEQVYMKASHFVSLSTFEGEDFGLSVCEALNAGLNCTLSLWGGYQEFKDLPQVSTCRIELQEQCLGLDQDEVTKSLRRLPNDPWISKKQFEEWMLQRKIELRKTISLSTKKKFSGFQESFKNHARTKMTGEFFIHDQKFLSPYWTPSFI